MNARYIVHISHTMYVMTPMDHMSQDVSYRSGPRTSGAGRDRVRRRKGGSEGGREVGKEGGRE